MATLRLNPEKLRHNYRLLKSMFDKVDVECAIVTKLLSGNEMFLNEILKLGPSQLCDSRISNLRTIKNMRPDMETIYIKPVPMGSIPDLLDVADISFNSELATLETISRLSLARNKKHKVIIAIELGDRREGIMAEDILDFFAEVFRLEGVEVIGLGANLNCMNGVLPSEDKMEELRQHRDRVERTFQRKIPIISGGSSVTIPLIREGLVPKEINHFRIGETLFFGADLFNDCTLEGFYSDVFEVEAELLELSIKPTTPVGELAKNIHGEIFQAEEKDVGRVRCQGLIDIGSLDIASKYLEPSDPNIQVIGSSSDMTVLEFSQDSHSYAVGSTIRFKPSYMVVLGLMNSQYVTKSLTSDKGTLAERSGIALEFLRRSPKRA